MGVIMKTNNLKNAFEDLRGDLQKNSDLTMDALEKRELLEKAPIAKVDIEKQINDLLDGYKHKAEIKLKEKLSYLSLSKGCANTGDLFTKSIKFDGSNLSFPDVDILVYFFRDAFKPQMKHLTELLVQEDAGLPVAERNKLITEIDIEIEELELEKDQLYGQLRDAGLTIKEEHVMDVRALPEKVLAQKPDHNPIINNKQKIELQKMKTSFDMHPNKRIEKRSLET